MYLVTVLRTGAGFEVTVKILFHTGIATLKYLRILNRCGTEWVAFEGNSD
jgi:hypothetical protein